VIRVRDLGVELQPVDLTRLIGHSSDRGIAGRCDHLEPVRHRLDAVAMTHPDLKRVTLRCETPKERVVGEQGHLRIPELAMTRRRHPAAELRGKRLHPVANPEHGHLRLEHGIRHLRRGVAGNGFGSARQNDAGRAEATDECLIDIEGVDLAIDTHLADTARDKLRVLRAEIENENTRAVRG
jgi:hypothetical protein